MRRINILSVACIAVAGVVAVSALQGVNRDVLKQHVKWSIFHEGCSVYASQRSGDNPAGQQEASIGWLRECYMSVQAHDQRAQDQIRNANDDLLLTITREAASEIPAEFHLEENFSWVAYHEGKMVEFRRFNTSADFDQIRAIYRDKQNHNPNAVNLLSAVSNQYIRDLINRI